MAHGSCGCHWCSVARGGGVLSRKVSHISEMLDYMQLSRMLSCRTSQSLDLPTSPWQPKNHARYPSSQRKLDPGRETARCRSPKSLWLRCTRWLDSERDPGGGRTSPPRLGVPAAVEVRGCDLPPMSEAGGWWLWLGETGSGEAGGSRAHFLPRPPTPKRRGGRAEGVERERKTEVSTCTGWLCFFICLQMFSVMV